jgi:hypothetical protein
MAYLFGKDNIFGKSFWDKAKLEAPKPTVSFAPPTSNDGATVVSEAGYYGTYLDMDGASRNESTLIERYRDISQYPDCENAIDDIVTQAIVATDDDVPVTINTDKLELPKNIRSKIDEEFKNVCKLLDFNTRGHDIFRRWYIDGRLYYHKIVDEKHPKQGILELRYLDPRKTRKVRTVDERMDALGNVMYETKQEFYIYSDNGASSNPSGNARGIGQTLTPGALQIAPESIAAVTSGILDLDKNLVLGYLHKAIRPVNHLRMMEDAMVIYRMTRSPERRIFYVDVSGLNKAKAEAYLKDLINRYRNKVVYESSTGEVKNNKNHMTMLEDFYLPRSNGSKGTEIATLPGLQNQGGLDDVAYFQTKLQNSLNVPISRMNPDGGFSGFGRVAEISRDELKFAKFIDRLRKRFTELFNDLLRTQLVLKGIITAEDWDVIKYDINYRFLNDTSMAEQRHIEDLRNKVELIGQMQGVNFIGTYMSKQKVMQDILKMSEDEIAEQQEQLMIEMQSDMEKQAQQMQLQMKLGMQPQQ